MRLSYCERILLSCINLNIVDSEDLSTFFSQNKNVPLFVIDDKEMPIGYINYDGYLEKLKYGKVHIHCFSRVLKEGKYSPNHVYTLFQNSSTEICIPVTDNNTEKLIGAYIKENSEINSYTHISTVLAKTVLPVFANEINNYLSSNWGNVYFYCTEDEFKVISKQIVKAYRYSSNDSSNYNNTDLIIDLKYSQKYRKAIISNNCKAECISLNDLLSVSLVSILDKYSRHKGFKILYVEGPVKEKINNCKQRWPSLFSGDSLETSFRSGNTPAGFSKDICLSENKIVSNGIHLIMADERSKHINISNGVRLTLPSILSLNSIHLYGSCLTYGSCVDDANTISSYLQGMLPGDADYCAINHGVRNGKNILNDFLYILNTPLGQGDYIIELNSFPKIVEKEIKKFSSFYEFSPFFNKYSTDECRFLDNTFHVNGEVNRLVALYLEELIRKERFERRGKTSDKSSYFADHDTLSRIDSSQLLAKGLLDQYISYLHKAKAKSAGYQKIGSVLLTANPFTLGHQYLVEKAKEKCDFLYVFVVQEDKFTYSFLERFTMVKKAVEAPDVMVLPTGDLMTANFTFPEYFTKDKNNNANLDDIPELHSLVFGSIVAKELGITMRFIGEEAKGTVTEKYNNYLISTLPKYGIAVTVIPRKEAGNGVVISASSARHYIDKGFLNKLVELVPQTSIDVLLKNNIDKVPVRSALWSTAYIVNGHFYKVYNFDIPKAQKREYEASLAAFSHGISTPVCHGLYKLSRTSCCVFEFIAMIPFSSDGDKDIISHKDELEGLFDKLKTISWDMNDSFWFDMHMKEFEYELSLLDKVDKYMPFLRTLTPSIFIHGDCFTGNMGISNDRLFIYDFQHACIGPEGWDKAYFASCFVKDYTRCLNLTDKETAMAECIAAIKLGRAIKKKAIDLSERALILKSWEGSVPETH